MYANISVYLFLWNILVSTCSSTNAISFTTLKFSKIVVQYSNSPHQGDKLTLVNQKYSPVWLTVHIGQMEVVVPYGEVEYTMGWWEDVTVCDIG